MSDTIQERPGLSDEDREYCLKRLENGAYYYSFQPTGCAVVDLILGAVSVAGKRYHHTEGWADDDYGPSCVEVIERAANEAADEIDRLKEQLRLANIDACNLIPDEAWQYIITHDQISAAWVVSLDQPDDDRLMGAYREGAQDALQELGIVPCPECGGTKRICEPAYDFEDAEYPDWEPCDCQNNGWVVKEKSND